MEIYGRSFITQHAALFMKGAFLLLFFFIGIIFVCSPWGKHIELLWYDTLFLVRGPGTPSDQVVVVAIDEPSFGIFRQEWPWPRQQHAELLETLFREGARVVAIDILFAEPSDMAGDQKLSEVIRSRQGAVMAAALEVIDAPGYRHSTAVYPLRSLISEETNVGIINLPMDSDGFVRRAFLDYGSMPSISLAAVKAFSREDGGYVEDESSMAENELMINYAGPSRTVPTVSYYQAMDPNRYLPEDFFKGKVVFIGLSLHTAPEIEERASDHFFYPYSRQGSNIISGVEIQATITGNLLSGNPIRRFPRHILWSCFIWAVGFFLIVFIRPTLGISLTCLLIGLFLLSVYCLFYYRFVYFPPLFAVLPVCAGCLAVPLPHLLYLRREKKYIRDVFSKYVSPKVVQSLLEDPKKLNAGGRMVNASVLYLDIAGFSKMASNVSPDELVATLSRYLGRFTETIFKWDGLVDKYVGDAIMAIWGVPLPQPDHADRACRAALDIRRNLKTLLTEDYGTQVSGMDIRIGINTGDMLAGNVGGRHFLDYTVHGEATNFAVRLEALNKLYGTHILIGSGTAEGIGDDFVVREIDNIRLEGQADCAVIYEVMGLSADMGSLGHRIEAFRNGRHLYLKRDFEAAAGVFKEIIETDDADGPSRIYLERCRRYQKEPPCAFWDGVADVRLK